MGRGRDLRAATVVAATVLLVAGCGGDDGGQGGDAQGSDSAQGAADDEAQSEEPVFDFPEGFETIVDDDLTGDEEKDALLRDHAYALKAMNESYVHQEATENFVHYWTAPVDSDIEPDFERYAEQNYTMVGTDHFYAREVVTLEGRRAEVTFCEDTSGGHTEEVETGAVVDSGQVEQYDDYRDNTMWFRKSDEGHWQVMDFSWSRGSGKCARAAR